MTLVRKPFFLDEHGFYGSLDPEFPGIEAVLRAARKRDYFKAHGLLLAYCRERPTPRFLFSCHDREDYVPLLRGHREFPGMAKRAGEACRHSFSLGGVAKVNLGSPINWNASPEGMTWAFGERPQLERDLFSDNCRNPLYVGDIRLTWELNHHHHLLDLARAWCLTGDERFAREAVFQIVDWIERNPVDQGVNWISLQAVSERVLSWMQSLCLLRFADSLTPDGFAGILRGILLHCRYLFSRLKEKEPFHGFPIVRSLALYYFSRLFPEFRESEAWNRAAVAGLLKFSQEVEAGDLLCGRSSSVAAYHARCLLMALGLARVHVTDLPPGIGKAAEALLDSLMWLVRPDGRLEETGEWCGCFDLSLPRLMALGSVLFGRGDFKAFSAGHEDLLIWLLGADDYRRYEKIVPSLPDENIRFFEKAGLLVFRDNWDASSSWLLFRGPESGPGGHADALSLSFFVQGAPVLVETGCRHFSGKMAGYSRGGWGHNVVMVDGEYAGELAELDSSPPGPLREVKSGEWGPGFHMEGSFTGKTGNGVVVGRRREIIFFPCKNALAVRDSIELSPGAEHRVEAVFHLGTSSEILRRGDGSCKLRTPGGNVWLIPYFPVPFKCLVGRPEGLPAETDLLEVRYLAAVRGPLVFHTFMVGSEDRFYFDPPSSESLESLFAPVINKDRSPGAPFRR